MKKLKKFEIGILASIPVLYAIAYFAFLDMAKPSTTPPVTFLAAPSSPSSPMSFAQQKSVTIITGNVPFGNYAVTFFKPAINLHKKMNGDQFVIRVHERA